MEQCNIRLPAAMIAALREQGKTMGLGFSAHVRAQLTATLRNPHNILKATKETVET